MAIPEAFVRLGQLTKELQHDLAAATELLKQEDSQSRRRAYIRTAFATIEGELFAIKQVLVLLHEARQRVFVRRLQPVTESDRRG